MAGGPSAGGLQAVTGRRSPLLRFYLMCWVPGSAPKHESSPVPTCVLVRAISRTFPGSQQSSELCFLQDEAVTLMAEREGASRGCRAGPGAQTADLCQKW